MKKRIRLSESDLRRVINESVRRILNEVGGSTLSDEDFPESEGHPDIYAGGNRQGKRYLLNYGADYGHKRDSSLLKNGVINRI